MQTATTRLPRIPSKYQMTIGVTSQKSPRAQTSGTCTYQRRPQQSLSLQQVLLVQSQTSMGDGLL